MKKLDKTYGEAKMPVKGLVKLAAMVADNNKKRKNALQIQKVIGEQQKYDNTHDDESRRLEKEKKKKRERFAKGDDRTTEKYNKDKLETSYQKTKLNQIFKTEETIVEKQGGDKKKPDIKINYRTAFTQDRELNSTPEDERGAAKRKETAEIIRHKKRDEIQRKKDEFKKK